MKALRKKQSGVKTRCNQFTIKIDGFFEFHPNSNHNVLFLQVLFLNLTPFMTKLSVLKKNPLSFFLYNLKVLESLEPLDFIEILWSLLALGS